MSIITITEHLNKTLETMKRQGVDKYSMPISVLQDTVDEINRLNSLIQSQDSGNLVTKSDTYVQKVTEINGGKF